MQQRIQLEEDESQTKRLYQQRKIEVIEIPIEKKKVPFDVKKKDTKIQPQV